MKLASNFTMFNPIKSWTEKFEPYEVCRHYRFYQGTLYIFFLYLDWLIFHNLWNIAKPHENVYLDTPNANQPRKKDLPKDYLPWHWGVGPLHSHDNRLCCGINKGLNNPLLPPKLNRSPLKRWCLQDRFPCGMELFRGEVMIVGE